ncbi:MAG: class I SAM-dependent RNA methyltransferase [Parachlamydiales bacterium]|nr:class I SAM-dependent RNA methyltransferase [Parachlamydiales bacterium]
MHITQECPHFNQCSGCTLPLSLDYKPKIYEKALDFFKNREIDAQFVFGELTQWRYRAKLAVRNNGKEIVVGLFKSHSHEVEPIPHCLVHHPHVNWIIHVLKEQFEKFGIKAYVENTNTGLVRYIQCVVNKDSEKVQVSFVLNQEKNCPEVIQNIAFDLQQKYPERIHSFWVNFQPSVTNVIFGNDWLYIAGEELFTETYLHQQVAFHPGSFGQANPKLFEKILSEIALNLNLHDQLLEMYAGVGTIGIALSSHCRSVTCCEKNKRSFEAFKISQRLDLKPLKCIYHCEDQLDTMRRLSGFNTLLVDPPRKGLAKELVDEINSNQSLEKIFYISCGFDSFTRDVELLMDGGWKIKSASLYLLFPGTEHIETVVVLKK